jgi:hypothetical protein
MKGPARATEPSVEEFAKLLGARYVDGQAALPYMESELYPSNWLPFDAHWNQAGADSFSSFMVEELKRWKR